MNNSVPLPIGIRILSFLLLIGGIIGLIGFYFIALVPLVSGSEATMPYVRSITTLFTAIVSIATAIGLRYRKRWALYALLLAMGMDLLGRGVASLSTTENYLPLLVILGIDFLVARYVWRQAPRYLTN